MDLVEKARLFAHGAHKAIAHRRKYTGECYTAHLEEVAGLVAQNGGSEAMIAAAWLHDVVEDTAVTVEEIEQIFGADVAGLVGWLTDVSKPEDGNRKARKALDRDHLALAPADAQTIKYCDLISNTSSIVARDPGFAKVYLSEKADLLDVMDKGLPELRERAREISNSMDQ